MRPTRASLALLLPLVLTGCGYVHFGRLPVAPGGGNDAALSAAYSNLATEHKILKQELALVRKEGDALRVALERTGSAGSTANSADVVARLTETSRELAALRVNYAKLQNERAASAPGSDRATIAAAQSALEEKLAASLRNYTQLQEENARLRSEVERTRTENLGLTDQLKTAAQEAERTQLTLLQLNTDLVAQKEARARAEQVADAARSQLTAVLAHGGNATPAATAPAAPRDSTASPLAGLAIAKAPPADSSPTAELRVNTERLLKAGPPTPVAKPPRVHVVQAGDTLEKLARQYYGAPDRWRTIYEANTVLLSNGQPLRAGMELQVPEN